MRYLPALITKISAVFKQPTPPSNLSIGQIRDGAGPMGELPVAREPEVSTSTQEPPPKTERVLEICETAEEVRRRVELCEGILSAIRESGALNGNSSEEIMAQIASAEAAFPTSSIERLEAWRYHRVSVLAVERKEKNSRPKPSSDDDAPIDDAVDISRTLGRSTPADAPSPASERPKYVADLRQQTILKRMLEMPRADDVSLVAVAKPSEQPSPSTVERIREAADRKTAPEEKSVFRQYQEELNERKMASRKTAKVRSRDRDDEPSMGM